jgi:8-oxo-dGTP diphosphatase
MKNYNVVAAIIFYDNKILCVKRGKTKFDYTSYKYEFPGGKIEENETEVEALKREIIEELEMNIIVKEKFLTVNHQYPDLNIAMHSYICSVESNNLTLTEHIEYKWLDVSELKNLIWAEADIEIVDKLLELF